MSSWTSKSPRLIRSTAAGFFDNIWAFGLIAMMKISKKTGLNSRENYYVNASMYFYLPQITINVEEHLFHNPIYAFQ